MGGIQTLRRRAPITRNPIQICQPKRLLDLLNARLDIDNKRVTVLGLAFPGTDDVPNSRAISLTERLEEQNTDVVAYDPVATENMCDQFPEIEYADCATNALADAAAGLVATDGDEFTAHNKAFEAMARKLVIDGWRVDLPIEERGREYEGLC